MKSPGKAVQSTLACCPLRPHATPAHWSQESLPYGTTQAENAQGTAAQHKANGFFPSCNIQCVYNQNVASCVSCNNSAGPGLDEHISTDRSVHMMPRVQGKFRFLSVDEPLSHSRFEQADAATPNTATCCCWGAKLVRQQPLRSHKAKRHSLQISPWAFFGMHTNDTRNITLA